MFWIGTTPPSAWSSAPPALRLGVVVVRGDQAAVDGQRGSGEPGRAAVDQEAERLRDLVRPEQPADRRTGLGGGVRGRGIVERLHVPPQQRRVDDPRAHGVDPHAVACVLDGGGAHDVEYALIRSSATSAFTLHTTAIAPLPRSTIAGSSACMPRTTPTTFTSKSRAHFSGSVWRNGLTTIVPAHATRQSAPPRASHSLRTASQVAGSDTSPVTQPMSRA